MSSTRDPLTPVDERRIRAIATPAQLEHVAKKLRALLPRQRRQPFEQVLGLRTTAVIADALDELARVRSSSSREREQRLEERVDALAILATSRRLPLAAVEAALRRAENVEAGVIPVEEIRRALAATEPRA